MNQIINILPPGFDLRPVSKWETATLLMERIYENNKPDNEMPHSK